MNLKQEEKAEKAEKPVKEPEEQKQKTIVEKPAAKPAAKKEEKPKTFKQLAEEEAKPYKFGTIIALFNKTKPVKKKTDAFCPHFMELKYANGCMYDCSWCYLIGTFGRWLKDTDFRDPRKLTIKPNGKYGPTVKPLKEITHHLETALDELDGPLMFNSGEVSDSLVDPRLVSNTIVPIFKKFEEKGHKLLILTKSSNVVMHREAMGRDAQKFMVISHSINANEIADIWEKAAPLPVHRIVASQEAHMVGYETRLRLDPMVPEGQWRKAYRHIIEEIMRLNPNTTVITLGTPRGLPDTLKIGNKLKLDMRWARHLTENSSWGKKIDTKIRIEMYEFAINEFKRLGYKGDISLCKETVEVWDALRENGVINYYPGQVLCNCVMTPPGIPEHYEPRSCDTCGAENSVPKDGHKLCRRCRNVHCDKCDDYHDIDDDHGEDCTREE